MGTCRNCNMSFDFDRVEPELAGQGFLFPLSSLRRTSIYRRCRYAERPHV